MNDQSFGGSPLKSSPAEHTRNEFARRSRAARQHRIEIFGPLVARELPWDILLLLYVNYERARLNVSSINADVGAPMTTVLRWLHHLEEKGLVTRVPHPTDGRIAYVTLTPEGKSSLDFYLDAALSVNNAGL